MTAPDTLDSAALIDRVVSDPMGLAAGVLLEAAGQLMAGGDSGESREHPDDPVAAALGARLVGMITGGGAEAGRHAELAARNRALAAALGACDCWGGHAACPVCHGAGGPGWVLPDRELFTRYVRPAVWAVTEALRGSSRHDGTHDAKETGDGRYLDH